MNTTNLGFKLLHPNQAGKEFDLNFNFWLIDFWLNPQISQFASQIPEQMQIGEAVIIDNTKHLNHLQIIIFLNKHHIILPKIGMKISHMQKNYIFENDKWQEVK